MAYDLFIKDYIRVCYFDYEQAVLLILLLSRISTIRSIVNLQVKSDCHVGTGFNLVTAVGFYSIGFSESLLNLEQKHEMVTAISEEEF